MNGLDFGFCGSAYDAPNPNQDMQRTINYYVEVSQSDRSKTLMSLLGSPGKKSLMTLAGNTEVRGCWVLPGGTSSLWVAGNTVYLVSMTVPATQTSIAQFSSVSVGTLLTNNGQVSIADNGAGGYAVIVDGQYGYYYRINGASSFQFTGGTTSASKTVTWPATVPSQLIVGSTITAASGNIPGGTTISSIDINGGNLTLSQASTGTNASDTLTVTLAAFGRITDPAFLAADRVYSLDGWLLFNQPGTQNIYTNAPTTYTLMFEGTFFAKGDVQSDNVVTHAVSNREWWVVGERHTEVWAPSSNPNFGFDRIPGVAPPIGCSAKHSIARLADSLVWLARSERGENVIIKTEQYSYQLISNRAIEHAISTYPLVSDAFGFVYLEEGHLFYVLTFPTADATWVYDDTSSKSLGSPQWHQRSSYDVAKGVFHRDRANCFTDFQNVRMVGDYQNGKLHRMSRDYYDDDGDVLKAVRRAPHIWSREDRKRLFYSALQVEFAPGVGLASGQGVNPQVMLRQSNDAGQTFNIERWTTVGAIGQTKNRAIWRKLGQARDTVFEVSITDPVKRDIVGATLFVGAEE